jgi:glycosyltransferase involved in cell wall biosynthesis
LVSVFESGSRPFIDHFFLAERCYLDELPRFKPATILENRFFGPIVSIKPYQIPSERKLRLLISGTITEVYGVLTGIQWFRELKKILPNSALHVIGHCPVESYRERLLREIDTEGLTLEIASRPISYELILEAYAHADIVLMPYWQIESIRDKVPSKLYESLALGKVCLFSSNPKWEKIVISYGAGLAVDFMDLSAIPGVVSQLYKRQFFTKSPDERLTWQSQEAEFLDVVSSLVQ